MESGATSILLKTKTMTSYEILKASVLDIIFENRNKAYGAYELRKHYESRLGFALGIMLSSILMITLLIHFFSKGNQVFNNPPPDVLRTVLILPPDIPEPEPLIHKPQIKKPEIFAQKNYTNRIEFVPDNVVTDLPEQSDLVDVTISGKSVDGPALTGVQQPALDGPSSSGQETNMEPEEPLTNFASLEKNAEYPGGPQAWAAFLNRHLHTPGDLDAGQKRVVMVRFAVGTDGSISQFQIIQSGGDAFDKEVIRVLKKMPKWKPAVQNGHKVSVLFTQPVTFMALEE